jgi:hypothetical protein
MTAILLLITGTGFSMNIHYCGGNLQDISFFNEGSECEMMVSMKKKACPMHEAVSTDCCEDQDVVLEADSPDAFIATSPDLKFSWVAIPAPSFVYDTERLAEVSYSIYSTYRPPPITKDIPVLVQSFLL